MSYFSIPLSWRIPEMALKLSMQEMAIDGARGCEGVAMWLGRHEKDVTHITHVAVLRGPGVRKAPDLLMISADLVNDIADLAIEHGLVLVGQIHSHGKLFGTDLSRTDRLHGIRVPGYLSAVAPDFAMRPHTPIEECGVHLFEPPGGWRRFPSSEIARRIQVIGGVHVPTLVAGTDLRYDRRV